MCVNQQDPILGITEAYLANTRSDKINLGVVRHYPHKEHTFNLLYIWSSSCDAIDKEKLLEMG